MSLFCPFDEENSDRKIRSNIRSLRKVCNDASGGEEERERECVREKEREREREKERERELI
jgi:hypothetical protein